MLKPTLLILSLTIALIVAIQPLQTVHAIIMTEAEWLTMNAANPPAVNGQKPEGQGNGFVRALKAPFKAIGRLFGRKKKNDNRLQRISEEDAKSFESSPAMQLSKSTAAAEVSSTGNATGSLASASSGDKNLADALSTSALDHLEKGRALLNSHDLNGAIGELSLAASENPNKGEASTLLGVTYWRKGLRDLAERSFQIAVQIERDNPQNLNNLGFLLYENGDYENAVKYLKRAAKLATDDPRIWNNLGLAQSERGHFDEAYQSFARAQGEFKGHLNVAARLEQRGQTKKAIKHLEKALELQRNSPDVLVRLLDLYDSEDKPEKAQTARGALLTLRTLADAAAK